MADLAHLWWLLLPLTAGWTTGAFTASCSEELPQPILPEMKESAQSRSPHHHLSCRVFADGSVLQFGDLLLLHWCECSDFK